METIQEEKVRYLIQITLMYCLSSLATMSVAGELLLEEGNLEDAKYLLVSKSPKPEKAIIIAHGSRPLTAALNAHFDYNSALYKKFLADGWLLASTSYSGNHTLPKSVTPDLEAFLLFLKKNRPEIKEYFIFGTSLGADAAVMMAEQENESLKGVVALCPSNYLSLQTSQKPKIPIIFVSNVDELDGVTKYIKEISGSYPKPILRKVLRKGHCKINDSEIFSAWQDFQLSLAGETIVATTHLLIEESPPESGAILDGNSLTVKILKIDPGYGNLTTNAVESDFEKFKVTNGEKFSFQCGEKTINLKLGNTYMDVWPSRWVAFFDEDGRLVIARNMVNAAESIDCTLGDSLVITK